MKQNLTQKILSQHLVSGELTCGSEISIRIDQTLTQDSTGTMAYLQFEAMGIDTVKTKKSVAYIDHNTLQSGFENADDHAYIQSVALKHGISVSKPGNGICHQIHLERFGVPGQTLLGSDSHTPTGGGLGMLAIGAGGLDVAVAMGGGALYLSMPKVVKCELKGKLSKNVSAKDIILEVLRRLSVKGGVGKVIEYTGEGVQTLSVPERATITNMGAELGATTSLFPSDKNTQAFLQAQGRGGDYVPLAADEGAEYDESLSIDLSALRPLAACPHSPDNVHSIQALIRDKGKIKVDQVCVGSCTNASYLDLMRVAAVLKGKTVHPDVSFTVSPGSKQVFTMMAQNGSLADLIDAGARILECACGPCIGMGQSPKTGAVSVRTFNRNFYARSGTASADVYLVSPETAAFTALNGYLTDPAQEKEIPIITPPARFLVNDNLILNPADFKNIQVIRGPNIKPFPKNTALSDTLSGKLLTLLEDNITTDHIMPSDSKLLPYRSNIPHLADYCLRPADPDFAQKAKTHGGGFIAAGTNYGQGSSREHAALVPLYLGVKAVIAKSFARIHKDNLINNGILPLTFANADDYAKLSVLDELQLSGVRAQILKGDTLTIVNKTKNYTFTVTLEISKRLKQVVVDGGVLAHIGARK
ncbi:MAG: aconitate hydratase [Firmicutes bacterium]|nr:aconitate hydratase [Bacillota bacterium]